MTMTNIFWAIIIAACLMGGYYATIAAYKWSLSSEHRKAVASCKDEFGRIDYERLEQVRHDTLMGWVKFMAATSRNPELDKFILTTGMGKMIDGDYECPIEEYAAKYDKKDKRKIQEE